jgi:TPR repeat protein
VSNARNRWVVLALAAALLSAAATAATAPTAAEIDRLRMHASAGRDDQALARLRTLAGADVPGASAALGLALLARRQAGVADEGQRWLARAAADGDGDAMLALGKTLLLGGPGVVRDGNAATRWFQQAAASPQPAIRAQAIYYQAIVARGGHGVPADPERAAELFAQAAQAGIADAMFQLGNAYASGEGVDEDARAAMRWYLRAAALDHPGAIQELAFAFERGDTLLPRSELQADNMKRALEHALRHPKATP